MFHHHLKSSLLNCLHLEVPLLGCVKPQHVWLDLKVQEFGNGKEKKRFSAVGTSSAHFLVLEPCPAGRTGPCTPSPLPAQLSPRQPWFWGDEFHTDTRGQLAARDQHFHSHLIFPALLIKQTVRADLGKNNYPGITHSRAMLLLQTNSILHSGSSFQLSTCSISQLLSSSVPFPPGMC